MYVSKSGSKQLSPGGPLVGHAQEFHCVFFNFPSNFPISLGRFTGQSRIGFVMLVFCGLIQSPETPTKERPQPQIMNKAALPLVPWPLFLGCYTECVLLAKPVMDVGLPLRLCLLDKEGISLN